MSMNILVETRVAPEIIFQKENPTLMAGEIAINEEGNGAKIGDGITPWSGLTDVVASRDTIQKWLTIATGTTNSRLVTLPDLNFAYSVVTADSNSMIEQVVSTIIGQNNYFQIVEEPISTYTYGTLILNGMGTQDVQFATNDALTKRNVISQIRFVSNNQYGTGEGRTYKFYDETAQGLITEQSTKITTLTNRVTATEKKLDDPSTGVQAINAKLIPFTQTKDGLVKAPSSTKYYDNFFLNAKNQWVQIKLTAQDIPLSSTDNTTIAAKITSLENLISNSGTKLTIAGITNQSVKNYVGTITGTNASTIQYSTSVYISNNVLMGAAWNDYAEARETKPIAAGRVVVENGDDTLSISTERLLLGGNIVSDTYGMLIGESDTAKTPIALCGRVLAYPNEDRSEYYAGAPVCTGPNGTVSIMTKDEVLHYPECIIGYVSAVPTYEEWNGKKVNGRIWIKVL